MLRALRCRSAVPVTLLVSGAVALTAACSNPSDGAPAASNTPSSPTTATGEGRATSPGGAPDPAKRVHPAAHKLREANSGHFRHTVTTQEGEGDEAVQATRDLIGRFNLERRQWQGDLTISLASAEQSRTQTLTLRSVDGELYVTTAAWPAEMRGRWLPTTPEQLAQQTGFLSSDIGVPGAIQTLLEMEFRPGEEAKRVAEVDVFWDRWLELIAAGAALATLEDPLDGFENHGHAYGEAKLTLAADGTPRQLVVTERQAPPMDLFFMGGPLQESTDVLGYAEVKLTLSRLGSAVSVPAPDPGDLIDPSEMPGGAAPAAAGAA